jgi:hypothetical protein
MLDYIILYYIHIYIPNYQLLILILIINGTVFIFPLKILVKNIQ